MEPPVEFSKEKPAILEALNKKVTKKAFPGEDGVTLLDGFLNPPIYTELSSDTILGGPTIPVVAVVGNTTGRIYHFAYKALVKD